MSGQPLDNFSGKTHWGILIYNRYGNYYFFYFYDSIQRHRPALSRSAGADCFPGNPGLYGCRNHFFRYFSNRQGQKCSSVNSLFSDFGSRDYCFGKGNRDNLKRQLSADDIPLAKNPGRF